MSDLAGEQPNPAAILLAGPTSASEAITVIEVASQRSNTAAIPRAGSMIAGEASP